MLYLIKKNHMTNSYLKKRNFLNRQTKSILRRVITAPFAGLPGKLHFLPKHDLFKNVTNELKNTYKT